VVTAARQIIEQVQRLDVRLQVVGDVLYGRPGGVLPEDVRQQIGALKAEIIVELQRRSELQEPSSERTQTAVLSLRGTICCVCRRLDRCCENSRMYVCPACAE
jgi:hypothetical protein